MSTKTQLQELEEAVKEGRQPICVACGLSLDCVETTIRTYIYWTWDAKAKRYVKGDSDGDADKPFCRNCENDDWDLVESGEASRKLGLSY